MEIEGIVLRVVPYKEKDAMITVLSKDGLSSFLARGIFKIDSKNALLTNLYTKAIFELTESKNGYFSLKSGKILNSSSLFMNDLETLLSLDALGELLLKTSDQASANLIYPYVENGYNLLIEKKIDSLLFITVIGIKYLMFNGYDMRVDGCVECGQKTKLVSFDFNSGGFLCHKHFDINKHTNQNPSYLRAVRHLFLVPENKLDFLNISLTDIVLILAKTREFMLDSCGINWSGVESLIKCRRI